MNEPLQSWQSLPETIKRQAAPDMLTGKRWMHFGCEIENPGERELRRWLPMPSFPPHRSNLDKKAAVLALLSRDWRMSNREIARMTGTSHTFVANVRRGKKRHTKEEMATVANVEGDEKC